MSVGKIIYYHRKKQNKTQEQLCKGICSVTHMSKIENNSKEVNLKTLQLLCERLGISIEEENKKTQLLKSQLNQLYDAIERIHKEKADTLYNELLLHKEYILCTDMIYLYELYTLRYLLFLNRITEFEQASEAMKNKVTKYSPFERYLWDFLQGVYHGQKLQYLQALEILGILEEQAEQYSEKVTDYYHFRSIIHGKLHHYSLSVHYAYKALRIFQNTGNMFRILHVKITLAFNLIYSNEFKRAEEILLPVLSDGELLQDTYTKAITTHNLGFLYHRQGNLQEALNYYSQSVQLKQKHTITYYNSLLDYIQTLIDLKENEQALNLLQQELDTFSDQKSLQYVKLMILYLQTMGEEKKLIPYLVKHGLPTMEQCMEFRRAVEYADIIAAHYQEKGELDSANQYLQVSNRLLKRMVFDDGKSV
ncbi:helix-turn-helix domain-containing protein [Bacillus sp. 165]|uniref:helix-turn-helix domain-containing protein n=1 Tax=Bacillus sp. 165 TaxID=1529117 RepID=UPI001ADAB87B|nr:helix-turn-helix domain-containing protein [Bacillus sp. 165]MBO9130679.1 helix-turn-helix domain-containing protein [Bacillus sp. 165]